MVTTFVGRVVGGEADVPDDVLVDELVEGVDDAAALAEGVELVRDEPADLAPLDVIGSECGELAVEDFASEVVAGGLLAAGLLVFEEDAGLGGDHDFAADGFEAAAGFLLALVIAVGDGSFEVVDAGVDARPQELIAGVGVVGEVPAAHAEGGDAEAGVAHRSIDHLRVSGIGAAAWRPGASSGTHAGVSGGDGAGSSRYYCNRESLRFQLAGVGFKLGALFSLTGARRPAILAGPLR